MKKVTLVPFFALVSLAISMELIAQNDSRIKAGSRVRVKAIQFFQEGKTWHATARDKLDGNEDK